MMTLFLARIGDLDSDVAAVLKLEPRWLFVADVALRLLTEDLD